MNRRSILGLLAVLGCGHPSSIPETAGTKPLSVAGAQGPRMSALDEFRQQPRLIFYQWGPGRAEPATIRRNIAFLETEREFIDGLVVFLPNVSHFVMGTRTPNEIEPLSYEKVLGQLQPMIGLQSKTVRFNFLSTYVGRPNDLFDDWSVAFDNWRAVARAVRDAGFVGLFFDNEVYVKDTGWTNYPDSSKYKHKSLREYEDQARLRGKQMMETIVSEFPEVVILVLHGPYSSSIKTPEDVFPGRHYEHVELRGPHFAGLLEGRGPKSLVVDGGEIYYLRGERVFKKGYQWRKVGIASQWADTQWIPPALRQAWPRNVSISWGVYNRPAGYGPSDMNPQIFEKTLAQAMATADHFVWPYFEGNEPMIEPGKISQDWVEAVRRGKQQGQKAWAELADWRAKVAAGKAEVP